MLLIEAKFRAAKSDFRIRQTNFNLATFNQSIWITSV